MTTRATVEGFTSAVEAGDFDTARSYLADDFQFTGDMMPEPLGPDEWLGMSRALRTGVPDLSYNFRIEEVEGDYARVSSQLTGTHTGDLDLSAMGMGVIPATGIAFEAEREVSEGEVNSDGYVQHIHLNSTPETGLAAMLAQLGVAPPGQ